jgi:uncharacterized damage-inducible protein DinB
MEIRTSFDRLLAYDRWANGQTLASLEACPDPPAKALELLGHVLGAESCWLDRMVDGRDRPGVENETMEDLATVRRAWSESLPAQWSSFLGDATLSDPARTFSYVSFLGKTLSCRVEDVLIQLMLHGSYHRGQIASAVRAAGGTPATTDFIHGIRTGGFPER